MLVKICGVTNVSAALVASQAGADMIGFVFAKSKRKVTIQQAKDISAVLPRQLKKVGVFVDAPLEDVEQITRMVGLDNVQLHGSESPAYCEKISVPVIKAFQIKDIADLQQVTNYRCAYYLLDSPKGQYQGGNGKRFDWKLTKFLPDSPDVHDKIILAGGLDCGNVKQAMKVVNPIGVDVSSGVETNGNKDSNKIASFIKEVKKVR